MAEYRSLEELPGSGQQVEWRGCGHTQCPVWRHCGLGRSLRVDWEECRTWLKWQDRLAEASARFLADYLAVRGRADRRRSLREEAAISASERSVGKEAETQGGAAHG